MLVVDPANLFLAQYRPEAFMANIKTDNAYDGVKDLWFSDEGVGMTLIERHAIMNIVGLILKEASDRFQFICPFYNIKPLKIPKSEVQPFTLEEVKQILKAVREDFRDFFTVRFFWKVLQNPIPPDDEGGPDIPFKDA